MTKHRFAHAFALLGILSSACGGAEEPAPAHATTTADDPAALPPSSNEQSAPPPGAESDPEAAASDVTDDEVTAFSSLHLELMGLQQQAALQVQQGAEPAEVQTQVDQTVTMLFDNSTLTPERYEEIAQRANTNDALRERIERELNQSQSAGGAGPGAGGGAGAAP